MVTQEKRYTLGEFAELAERPENASRLLELIGGEIVEKMPSFTPSQIGLTIGTYIRLYLMKNPLGYVTGADGGYILSDEDVVVPDVGYISKENLPQKPPREAPLRPDFAVEVKSPTNSKRELRRKAEKYLASGTRLVWLVFPDETEVEVYVPEADVSTVRAEGRLDGADVLPGFTLALKDIFPAE